MWIIILSTLFVAFVSGISFGAFVERGLWESALGRARRRIEAHRNAAAQRRGFRVVEGDRRAAATLPMRAASLPGITGNHDEWRRAA